MSRSSPDHTQYPQRHSCGGIRRAANKESEHCTVKLHQFTQSCCYIVSTATAGFIWGRFYHNAPLTMYLNECMNCWMCSNESYTQVTRSSKYPHRLMIFSMPKTFSKTQYCYIFFTVFVLLLLIGCKLFNSSNDQDYLVGLMRSRLLYLTFCFSGRIHHKSYDVISLGL